MATYNRIASSIILLFLVFWGTFRSFTLGSEACPSEEDIKPCQCRKFCNYCPSQVQCHDIDTIDTFNLVIERTNGHLFKDFLLLNTCILYIPAEAVEKKKMEKLYIRGGCLSGIFDRAPVTSDLRELHIQSTIVQRGMQWSLLSNTSLVIISIKDSRVQKLSKHFGKKLPKTVKTLSFEGTRTRYIAKGAFEGLDNLQNLVLVKTYIKDLRRDMFPRPWNIGSLFITHNLLEVLPDDIFKYMPKLLAISLNNNNISTIKQNVFGDIYPQLSLLKFNDNPIVCDCDVEWLATKVKKPYIHSGICSKPERLEGKILKNLTVDDFRPC